jgi:chromosome segregation protein
LEETLRQDRSRYLSLKELQENYEGYEKGVRSILLRKREELETWKGMLGAVADILEPDPKYEIPLEAVLGQRLQYLIVEGEKEGMEAMVFLKRESLGRGSFIPILPAGRQDGVQEISTGNRIVHEEGKPVPLSRFVKVKERFASIAEFLIGDVGVVESWDWNPRHLRRGCPGTLWSDVRRKPRSRAWSFRKAKGD